MANKSEYIDNLQAVIGKMHECGSTHVESVSVHEVFQGQTVWQGVIEVFDLSGHPKAKRAYAWAFQDGAVTRYVAVRRFPPSIRQ